MTTLGKLTNLLVFFVSVGKAYSTLCLDRNKVNPDYFLHFIKLTQALMNSGFDGAVLNDLKSHFTPLNLMFSSVPISTAFDSFRPVYEEVYDPEL